ncbi:acyltransferase family protein [Clostridium sp. WILCCON 0269]|uniref:Acyltransferase family protein n=1 Tax=Candidatus Clostridium eludens TaxID=3381663 RepID=A0ABW8SPY3_9CLOT
MLKERLKEIDILRAIAFIFVIEQHTLGGAFGTTAKNNFSYYCVIKFFYTIAQSAVPIFLCISGISLFYVYSRKFDLKKYYSKRLIYVYVPYVIWSIIYGL